MTPRRRAPEVRGALGAALTGLTLCLASTALAADETVRAWLTRMTEALAQRNYAGEFLHLSHGRVEKLRILHRVAAGRVTERLVSLSGSGREIVRDDTDVYCYLPDQRKVLVEPRAERESLLGSLPSFDADLEANYRLDLLGHATSLLGRDALVVSVAPRDRLRFGYRLWIDAESHMPVRTDLCDADGEVLEQVLFTSLDLPHSLSAEALRPGVHADDFLWERHGSTEVAPAGLLPWRVTPMPPGFHLSSASSQRVPGSRDAVTHLVLSDGLASVSVFIEPAATGRPSGAGQGRIGSAFAYATVVDGHRVTAVGEVPAGTVQSIATAVLPVAATRH